MSLSKFCLKDYDVLVFHPEELEHFDIYAFPCSQYNMFMKRNNSKVILQPVLESLQKEEEDKKSESCSMESLVESGTIRLDIHKAGTSIELGPGSLAERMDIMEKRFCAMEEWLSEKEEEQENKKKEEVEPELDPKQIASLQNSFTQLLHVIQTGQAPLPKEPDVVQEIEGEDDDQEEEASEGDEEEEEDQDQEQEMQDMSKSVLENRACCEKSACCAKQDQEEEEEEEVQK